MAYGILIEENFQLVMAYMFLCISNVSFEYKSSIIVTFNNTGAIDTHNLRVHSVWIITFWFQTYK